MENLTKVQKRLINAYTILVMGKRAILEEDDRVSDSQRLVPSTVWQLTDGTETTLNVEVEMEVALREIIEVEKAKILG